MQFVEKATSMKAVFGNIYRYVLFETKVQKFHYDVFFSVILKPANLRRVSECGPVLYAKLFLPTKLVYWLIWVGFELVNESHHKFKLEMSMMGVGYG